MGPYPSDRAKTVKLSTQTGSHQPLKTPAGNHKTFTIHARNVQSLCSKSVLASAKVAAAFRRLATRPRPQLRRGSTKASIGGVLKEFTVIISASGSQYIIRFCRVVNGVSEAVDKVIEGSSRSKVCANENPQNY